MSWRRPDLGGAPVEVAAYLATPDLPRYTSSAVVDVTVTGLLGRYPRIAVGALAVRLDAMDPRPGSSRAVSGRCCPASAFWSTPDTWLSSPIRPAELAWS